MNSIALATVLLAVAASAAGWAIFGASAAVLEAMQPTKTGRWASATGWCAALFVGLNMAMDPRSYDWEAVVLACSLAIVVWRNIHRLRDQATRPSPFRGLVPIAAVGLVAGCMAMAPAMGAEMLGRAIHLTDDEFEACRDRGGCVVMTGTSYEKLRAAAGRCATGA